MEWNLANVLWTMFVFFIWVIWIWLLITVFIDIFRSRDLNGWGKALWAIFVVVFPYLGVFIYLIARGGKMHERAIQDAAEREKQFRSYVQDVSGGGGTADELTRLADLRDKGVLTDEEFQAQKAKLLA